MPRNPISVGHGSIPRISHQALRSLMYPLSSYSKCESRYFLSQAITHAFKRDLSPVHANMYLIPSKEFLQNIDPESRGSKDGITAISNTQDIERASSFGASYLINARSLFEQTHSVNDEVRPILYYYSSLAFLDFITSVLVKRERKGHPSHGLTVSCSSEGWDFNQEWPSKSCKLEFKQSGDFPFFVDVLTICGWPSLFSTFRVHQETKNSAKSFPRNPAPIGSTYKKISLDSLCTFDFNKYLSDNPQLQDWLAGTDKSQVLEVTSLLMDFLVVFVSSNLARYYVPAWKNICENHKSDIFNDIKSAYIGTSEGLPNFFRDKHPFKYSFGTRIE